LATAADRAAVADFPSTLAAVLKMSQVLQLQIADFVSELVGSDKL